MIWNKLPDLKPTEDCDCLLYGERADKVLGPIRWVHKEQAWIDLFFSNEAGAIFYPDGKEGSPTHWALWNGPEDEREG